MRRRSAALSALAACALAAAGFAPGASATAAAHGGHGPLIPAVTGTTLPTQNATVDSLNWSGYATAPGSGITAVKSTFTVPTVQLAPPGFAANWTGIGGYNTQDLIQAGTSEDELQGYYAWYEILPASETPIPGNVNPGEVMTIDIHNVGTNLWSVTITNNTEGWSWQKNISYVSSESSAEWIFEAPTVVVQTIPANTGVNYFGPTSTFTNASGTHTIAQGNPDRINMGLGVNEATPSNLNSNGQSFNVCAYQQTCPTPAS
jgi:hypothetical protein